MHTPPACAVESTLPAGPAPGLLTIDLGALDCNYRELSRLAAPARVAAVVKANAYGLGLGPVADRLLAAGCDTFFVASLAEALELRALQPRVRICSLGGLAAGTASAHVRHAIVPVLNSAAEVRDWVEHCPGAAAALQLDTGMTRSGLSAHEAEAVSADAALLAGLRLELVMTQLACADEPAHPLNAAQVARFDALRACLPPAPTSIGNSAGGLLGPAFRGDVVRSGIALFGGRPFATGPNPMREVVRLQGRVLQVHEIDAPDATVGYGASYRVRPPARFATVGVGYADGYPRALSDKGAALVGGRRVPVAGRVSMDLLTLDVTSLPAGEPAVGDYVDLIGGGITLDEVAAAAGTISYEVLTRLAPRLLRVYR